MGLSHRVEQLRCLERVSCRGCQSSKLRAEHGLSSALSLLDWQPRQLTLSRHLSCSTRWLSPMSPVYPHSPNNSEILESAQGWIAPGRRGMGRQEGSGGKPRTDTRTDKRTYLNGSKTPQVNAKWDSVQIISFWHSDRHKHTQGKNLYIFAMQAVKIMNAQ